MPPNGPAVVFLADVTFDVAELVLVTAVPWAVVPMVLCGGPVVRGRVVVEFSVLGSCDVVEVVSA